MPVVSKTLAQCVDESMSKEYCEFRFARLAIVAEARRTDIFLNTLPKPASSSQPHRSLNAHQLQAQEPMMAIGIGRCMH